MSTQYIDWGIPKPVPQEWRSEWRLTEERRRAEERIRFVPKPTVRLEVTLKPKRTPRPPSNAPRRPRTPQPSHYQARHRPICAECPAKLYSSNAIGLCQKCVRVKRADDLYGDKGTCSHEGCGKELRRGSKTGLCAQHAKTEYMRAYKAKNIQPTMGRVPCANECGRNVSASNDRGTCYTCHNHAKRKQARRLARKQCANGCGSPCRSGAAARADGMCGTCGANADARIRNRQLYLKKIMEGGRTCDDCGKPIYPKSVSGLCAPHALARVNAKRLEAA